MTQRNVSALLAGKRGQEFIDTVRALAVLSEGRVLCGTCRKKALYIGMQRCGAPGGPVCQQCLDEHRDWLNTADVIAEAKPYCRHCNEDVGRDHIYAVSLYDSTASEVVM